MTEKYLLPNWKKISFSKDRNLSDLCLENQMSVLVLELKSPESRDLVIKLRVANDYDTNLKILNEGSFMRLKTILEELGGNSEELTKEGIYISILKEILR